MAQMISKLIFRAMMLLLTTALASMSFLNAFSANVFAATDNTTTIYYKKGYSTPYIHYKQANGLWTAVPGIKMADSEVSGYAKITISLGSNTTLTACFNNGSGQWDSRNGANYSFGIGISTFDGGKISAGAPAGAITPTPTPVPTTTAVPSIIPTATPAPTSTPVSTATIAPTIVPTATIAPTAVPTTAPIGNSFTVNFTMDQCYTSFGQSCWIVGTFSNWSTNGGIKLNTSTNGVAYPKWSASKTFTSVTDLKFKIVVAPDGGGAITKWEGGNDRSLTVNSTVNYVGTWGSTSTTITTPAPTTTPTIIPTATPTIVPTATPTIIPTATPTIVPTATPTIVPTVTPTIIPTATPIITPTPSATPGVSSMVIYYKSSKTTYAHFNANNSGWTIAPGIKLHASEYFGYNQWTYSSDSSFSIIAAFNDGANNWDNYGGKNYTLTPGVYTIENGVVRSGTPYTGGNIVTVYFPKNMYDYGRRYQQIFAHYRPEGSTNWTALPGVNMYYKDSSLASHVRADLNIGNATKIAELAFHISEYGGSSWANNGGANYRNLEAGKSYTFYYDKLLNSTPDQLPAVPMTFDSAVRGYGHGCYEFCAYLSGSLHAVTLGSTQRIIVNYQIPNGTWKSVDAIKSSTINPNNQLWTFNTPSVYMESPKQFYFQYVVDGQMIYVDNHYTTNYYAESAAIVGTNGIIRDCGTGFGSRCGYSDGTTMENGAIVNKELNNGLAPVVEVVYKIGDGAEQVITASSTAQAIGSLNGLVDANHVAYRYFLPLESGKTTTFYLRTVMNGKTYSSLDANNMNGVWFIAQP